MSDTICKCGLAVYTERDMRIRAKVIMPVTDEITKAICRQCGSPHFLPISIKKSVSESVPVLVPRG